MKARWGLISALIIAALAAVPLAAGAQAPPTTVEPITEGSAPPGGTVNCELAPTLTPDHGPPGTEVDVFGEFSGNCDDVNPIFLESMTCTGQVTGAGLEGFSFPVEVTSFGKGGVAVQGTFTAPAVEPDPPVVDAIEDLAVTVTCTVPGPTDSAPGTEGGLATTYVYPPAPFALELFAANDGDQPTLVDNDADVVSATPAFTG